MKRLHLVLFLMLFALYANAQNTIAVNSDAMLNGLNELRVDGCTCGTEEVKPAAVLHWDKKLAEIALDYAIQLKNDNQGEDKLMFMSHVGTDGSTIESRLSEAGYQAKTAFENIAFIKGNEDLVIDYWLNNPLSCKNIMNKKVTAAGAARAGDFWVLILARPK